MKINEILRLEPRVDAKLGEILVLQAKDLPQSSCFTVRTVWEDSLPCSFLDLRLTKKTAEELAVLLLELAK